MFKGKKSWILMVLAVQFLVAAPNTEAENLFYNGDMEAGGGPTTPPDYWGGGTADITGSTDTPWDNGLAQSLSVLGDTALGSSYSVGYSKPVLPETDYEVSFWHKGDVYTGAILVEGAYEWTKESYTITTNPGQTTVSMYFYDWNFEDALPLLIDNVSLTLPPEPDFLLGDANGDGVVSAGDYAAVQANFGNTSGGVAPAVPEPTTMCIVGIGLMAVINRRRK